MLDTLLSIVTLLVAGFVAWIAIGTLRLRIRVDHADQWWKRVQYGVDKALEPGGKSQVVGMDVIESLLEPALNGDESYGEKVKYILLLQESKKFAWRVSQSEKIMLERIASKLTLGAPQPLTTEDLEEVAKGSRLIDTETKEGGNHDG